MVLVRCECPFWETQIILQPFSTYKLLSPPISFSYSKFDTALLRYNLCIQNVKPDDILRFNIFILWVWVFCLHVCIPGACGGQETTLDPLGLELWTVVICHSGTGN